MPDDATIEGCSIRLIVPRYFDANTPTAITLDSSFRRERYPFWTNGHRRRRNRTRRTRTRWYQRQQEQNCSGESRRAYFHRADHPGVLIGSGTRATSAITRRAKVLLLGPEKRSYKGLVSRRNCIFSRTLLWRSPSANPIYQSAVSFTHMLEGLPAGPSHHNPKDSSGIGIDRG